MIFDEFILKQKRKASGDLVADYLEEVFGIAPLSIDFPKNYFIRFEHYEQLTKAFVRIHNTSDFVPQKGDLCVWGSGVCGGKGCAAIASGRGNRKRFYILRRSKNGRRIKRERHNYSSFLGVLRSKTAGK